MRRVWAWLAKYWLPLGGIAFFLVSIGVLRNPIADLQAGAIIEKAGREAIVRDVDRLKQEQPTARDLEEQKRFESDVRRALADLARTTNATSRDVTYIEGQLKLRESGNDAGDGE